jgi:hypothetical protein
VSEKEENTMDDLIEMLKARLYVAGVAFNMLLVGVAMGDEIVEQRAKQLMDRALEGV